MSAPAAPRPRARALPLDDLTRHFGPYVARAGLAIWYVSPHGTRFTVGTLDGSIRTDIDPNWAYGGEQTSFELIAHRLKKESRS